MKGGVDITPTLQDTEGLPLMLDVCVRQLYTPNQSLLSDPSHQSIDLRQFLSTDMMARSNGTVNTNTVRSAATAALLADPRIFSANVVVEWHEEAPGFMTVYITGVGAEGPFALTLGVSRVTIQVLQQ
jgi:hypothetical protein